jgi:hypothetical protein
LQLTECVIFGDLTSAKFCGVGELNKEHAAARGSQRWLQIAVNERSTVLNSLLRPAIGLDANDNISWLSPLKENGYREFHDNAFLECLKVNLTAYPLETFWPYSGPRWDGLVKTSRGDVLLLEAKSHIGEMLSECAASAASRPLINASLDAAKNFFGAGAKSDWTQPFYQYANRLAHLYLLREKNGCPAWLVNIYFVNDNEMKGPNTVNEWRGALEMTKRVLGLGKSPIPFAVDVFVDVNDLIVTP